MKKPVRALLLVLCLAALAAPLLLSPPGEERLPGTAAPERFLLTVWDVSGPTGSSAWLRQACAAFEKRCPGAQVYLRTVAPDEVMREGAVLPDVVVFSTGTFTDPEQVFLPLSGETAVHPELARSACWKGLCYALPLCWEGHALVMDGALFPESAVTPAPTTLLGRPAATPPPAQTPAPDVSPWEVLAAQPLPVAACMDTSLLTLASLRAGRAVLPLSDAAAPAAASAALVQGKACAALLPTGVLMQLEARIAAGEVRPMQVCMPGEVLSPVVLYGALPEGAGETAALFLRFLTEKEQQTALSRQSLFSAREDVTLYPAGTPAALETAAARLLYPINAFLRPEETARAAWQSWTGAMSLAEGIAPLR